MKEFKKEAKVSKSYRDQTNYTLQPQEKITQKRRDQFKRLARKMKR